MLYFSVDILVVIIKNLSMLLFVVFNNKFCLQYGFISHTLGDSPTWTVTLPMAYTGKYNIFCHVMCDIKSNIDAKNAEGNTRAMKLSNTQMYIDLNVTSNRSGAYWFTIGY